MLNDCIFRRVSVLRALGTFVFILFLSTVDECCRLYCEYKFKSFQTFWSVLEERLQLIQLMKAKNEMMKESIWGETASRRRLSVPDLLNEWKRTSLALNLYQFLLCLSRLTEATVMCFDQCHSGSADRPSYHRRLPAGLRCRLYVCVCTCVCVWWQMRGGSHRARRDGADNLESLSSWRLSLTWALQRLPHAHRPDTRWDSLVIYLCSQTRIRTQHTDTRAVYIPGGILKSFSASFRESLALMLINVRGSAHDGERTEGEDQKMRDSVIEVQKIFGKVEILWNLSRNAQDRPMWRMKIPEWRKQVKDKEGVKTAKAIWESIERRLLQLSYPDACADTMTLGSGRLQVETSETKCCVFPLQQGQLLRHTHTHMYVSAALLWSTDIAGFGSNTQGAPPKVKSSLSDWRERVKQSQTEVESET